MVIFYQELAVFGNLWAGLCLFSAASCMIVSSNYVLCVAGGDGGLRRPVPSRWMFEITSDFIHNFCKFDAEVRAWGYASIEFGACYKRMIEKGRALPQTWNAATVSPP